MFEPAPDRPDPVTLLESQADARVPELVPIRYGRMLASPFTFYRGAALIMAADLAHTPDSGLRVQCCGDAHLSNFGLYASPERRLVFDINDFDETLPGPWEWDVKRLAVSMLIAARNSEFSRKQQDRIVLETVAEYRVRMAEFAAMRNLDVWYTHFEIEKLMPRLRAPIGGEMRKRLDQVVAKARRRDSLQAFAKLSKVVDGEPRIVSRPPLIVRLDDFPDSVERDRVKADIQRLLRAYAGTLRHECHTLLEQYRLVDIARKVVGVGSVGTDAWVALLLGRDGRDPLLLQVKEAQASVMEAFVGASEFENAGERVVAGQRIMQASSDIFLGWLGVAQRLEVVSAANGHGAPRVGGRTRAQRVRFRSAIVRTILNRPAGLREATTPTQSGRGRRRERSLDAVLGRHTTGRRGDGERPEVALVLLRVRMREGHDRPVERVARAEVRGDRDAVARA